ncbi:MAG: septum site-determining protein Ssd [Arachnia sp.]
MTTASDPIIATRSPAVAEAVAATSLALGVEVRQVETLRDMASGWSTSALVLLGTDLASRAGALPRRTQPTYLVGMVERELIAASSELAAPTLLLPDHAARLADLLTVDLEREAMAETVLILGGSGGVGTSSLVVALAAAASQAGSRAAAIELADGGAGIDLLFGAEMRPGLRWGDLGQAAGEMGVLDSELLHADSVSVLAASRSPYSVPDVAAVSSVTRALARSHDWLLIDGGRAVPEGLPRQPRLLLVVGGDVSCVAAARIQGQRHDLSAARVVVRRGPGRQLSPASVASSLGLPLAGVISHDPAVPKLAADGSNVASSAARRFRRDVQRLWKEITA